MFMYQNNVNYMMGLYWNCKLMPVTVKPDDDDDDDDDDVTSPIFLTALNR